MLPWPTWCHLAVPLQAQGGTCPRGAVHLLLARSGRNGGGSFATFGEAGIPVRRVPRALVNTKRQMGFQILWVPCFPDFVLGRDRCCRMRYYFSP